MDFDEIEYLEKTLENPEPPKAEEKANGVDDAVKSDRKSSRHRSRDDDNDDDDGDRRSKRAKSRDDVRDRDRDHRRDRESSQHRSSSHRSRDGERIDKDRHRSSRDKDRAREERNGRDHRGGDRDKEREKERERKEERNGRDHRGGVRDKEREKERERKEREREIELEQERFRRSRSRSERRRSEIDKVSELERDRERSRDREIRDRDREARRHKEKKEEVEPEADPERDQRTVFAYQICLKADERDVYEFFSMAGKVRDVRLIMDRNSRRSKGVGYIEFYDAMSVPMAIAMSGQPLLGKPVMVKPSEAEKNLVQSTTAIGGSIGPYSGGARRLYVGNLDVNITEDQLRQVFESFGQVELVQLPLEDTGRCKGFGFVQFARLEDARAAQSLNGQLDIAGRTIKVSAVSEQVESQETGANAGDFDDDDGGGLHMNAQSRAILMQKLDRTGTAFSITGSMSSPVVNGSGLPLATTPGLGLTPPVAAPLIQTTLPALAGLSFPSVAMAGIDSIGVPSECLLLKNMFDPKSETEPDFDLDIKEDVREECSKFGDVKHIYVDKNSCGFVYLRFDSPQSAMSAQRALHGRWFAGKMIEASYMIPHYYATKFPDNN